MFVFLNALSLLSVNGVVVQDLDIDGEVACDSNILQQDIADFTDIAASPPLTAEMPQFIESTDVVPVSLVEEELSVLESADADSSSPHLAARHVARAGRAAARAGRTEAGLPVDAALPNLKMYLECKNLPKERSAMLVTKEEQDPYIYVQTPQLRGTRRAAEDAPGPGVTNFLTKEPNPVFLPILVPFDFTHVQPAVFTVVDKDFYTADDDIGSFQVNLGVLLKTVVDGGATFPLTKGGRPVTRDGVESTCSIRRAFIPVQETLEISFAGASLAAKDHALFGKGSSDPYLHVFAGGVSGKKLGTTNTVTQNLNPSWKPLEIPVESFSTSDDPWNAMLTVQAWDYDMASKDDIIGECSFPAYQLRIPKPTSKSELCTLVRTDEKGKKKYGDQPQGTVLLKASSGVRPLTIGDYIEAGVDLSFDVAVDLTQSNIFVQPPLHPRRPDQQSMYRVAMEAIGRVVDQYDSDHIYDLYTFGGRMAQQRNGTAPPPARQVAGQLESLQRKDAFRVEAQGVDGLMEQYDKVLAFCNAPEFETQMSGRHEVYGCYHGPTLFAPVLDRAIASMRLVNQHQKPTYKVLLVLTDGVNHDRDATMAKLVEASALPISVIYIGIGPGPFDRLEFLDGDTDEARREWASAGYKPRRDVVQFVDYPEQNTKNLLSGMTLEEVPHQLMAAYAEMGGGLPTKLGTRIENMGAHGQVDPATGTVVRETREFTQQGTPAPFEVRGQKGVTHYVKDFRSLGTHCTGGACMAHPVPPHQGNTVQGNTVPSNFVPQPSDSTEESNAWDPGPAVPMGLPVV